MDKYFKTWKGKPDDAFKVIDELMRKGVDFQIPELVEKLKTMGYMIKDGRIVLSNYSVDEFLESWNGEPMSMYDMIHAIKNISPNRFSVQYLQDKLAERGYRVDQTTSLVTHPNAAMDEFLDKWDKHPMSLKDIMIEIQTIQRASRKVSDLIERLDKMGFKVDEKGMVVSAGEC